MVVLWYYKMVLRFGSVLLSSPLSVTASIVKLGIVTSSICQVFWFLCNSSFVVALNFVVNLRLSGQFPNIEAIYHLLKLDEVYVVNHNDVFNAIVVTVILTGNISTSLYFLYIKGWQERLSLTQKIQ